VEPAGVLLCDSDFKTTQQYIDLAGEVFRAEAEALETRLWGSIGTKSGYQTTPADLGVADK
jgi:hypothetical protein